MSKEYWCSSKQYSKEELALLQMSVSGYSGMNLVRQGEHKLRP